MKQHAPATLRNREPLLDVLAPLLPDGALVLEVASGTGEHAVFLAARLPGVVWQPSDVDATSRASIEEHRREALLPNLRAPLALDAASATWPIDAADAVVCINMIHIAPFEACEGLVAGAGRLLRAGGVLFLYGPYRIDGALAAPSNVAFDESLRSRDPSWGVRELADVTNLAERAGFSREAVVPMPANNHSVVFRRNAT